MTNEQIKQLQQEAAQAGDEAMVRICAAALAGDEAARAECDAVAESAAANVDEPTK